MTRDPKPRLRWTADLHDRFVDAVTKLGALQGDFPIAETLMCQMEVQKRLQDQLEVQTKLQMRIEIQGKYLQAILEKAQTSFSLDMNCPCSLEATRNRLTNFNLALSNLMENLNGEERNNGNIIEGDKLDAKINGKASIYKQIHKDETKKNVKIEVEVGGGSINFDLNTRGSYDFIGINEANATSFRR
ncbi:hypothetical protein LguiB_026806 [Lonicera macranthoides]